ncbi:hypothetical protein EXIGLDRAFT_378338 [Exidia glandulosa HHB12029]|uniref:ATPase AAA-type core domain-containing protein n=1 Tax=Exidia glandulosa HHB12029 TaxID=1314781 RepID=A0A166B2G6_EXIGL|nr:hypothetical protein EXIGLDRAFT_378338 [Exidia glandulosa HHB12029]
MKTALLTMVNMTDGLPFPYKAVAQTVLQFHEHIESYRQIDDSITALLSKIDDFVTIVARPGGRKINSGDEAAEAIEAFFRAVQSIIVRLEILRATRPIKRFAAPGAVGAAVAEEEENLDHARKLLNTSLQVDIHNTVHEIRDAQILAKSDVNYSSALPANPTILHGRDDQLRSLVDLVVDRSRPIRLAIMGAGGLGKTTLANAVIQHTEVATRFGDRRFFIGAEAASGVDDLLSGMLTTFSLPASSDPLASLLKHFRSHDQSLLVIDNLETIWNSANATQRNGTERVLSQLNTIASLTFIVTCRGAELPPDVNWANRDAVVLSTLSPEAARATFHDIAGDVPPSDQPVRDALLKELDYMPLAVTLLARLVERGKQLPELERRWNKVHTSMLRTQPNGRLDNVEASIQLSIAYLPSDDLEPLQLLSLCAQLPDGMRLPVRNELEHLCGFRDVEGALDIIQGLALVYVTDDETIRMLSPIRLYVLEKHKPSAAHRASLLEIYYGIASEAPQKVDTRFRSARDQILPELRNLENLLLAEITTSNQRPSSALIKATSMYSRFSFHFVPNDRLLVALIQRIDHLPLELGRSLLLLSDLQRSRDNHKASLESAVQAKRSFESVGDLSGAADSDLHMAHTHGVLGNLAAADTCLSAARDAFIKLGKHRRIAYCDLELGAIAYDRAQYDDAAALFASAREEFFRVDDKVSVAHCQLRLGDIHLQRKEYDAAATVLESALQEFRSLDSTNDIATCSISLSKVYRRQKRFDNALDALQVAYDQFQKQDNSFRMGYVLRRKASVLRDQSNAAGLDA